MSFWDGLGARWRYPPVWQNTSATLVWLWISGAASPCP